MDEHSQETGNGGSGKETVAGRRAAALQRASKRLLNKATKAQSLEARFNCICGTAELRLASDPVTPSQAFSLKFPGLSDRCQHALHDLYKQVCTNEQTLLQQMT